MRKLFLAIVLCLFTLPATAQVQSQNFVHEFENYDVYVRLSTLEGKDVSWVETARLEDHVCKRLFVQPVDVRGDTIRFSETTKWTIDPTPEGIQVAFPDGTEVDYQRTSHDGISHCLTPKREL